MNRERPTILRGSQVFTEKMMFRVIRALLEATPKGCPKGTRVHERHTLTQKIWSLEKADTLHWLVNMNQEI